MYYKPLAVCLSDLLGRYSDFFGVIDDLDRIEDNFINFEILKEYLFFYI